MPSMNFPKRPRRAGCHHEARCKRPFPDLLVDHYKLLLSKVLFLLSVQNVA